MRLSECPVRATIDVIDGKWKPIIVNALKPGDAANSANYDAMLPQPRESPTEQLRELEKDQIITRKVLGQRPWSEWNSALTPTGVTLVPVLTLMAKWGKKHKKSGHANNGAEAAGAAPSSLLNREVVRRKNPIALEQ